MFRFLVFVVALLAIPAAAAADAFVVGGNVFVTATGTFVPNPGIVVRSGRFFAIGSDASPHGDLPRVQLEDDDYVLPGLVDLHAHYNVKLIETRRDETHVNPVVYLANGVTTTFPAGEYNPDDMLDLRKRIDAGKQVGPRLLNSGPYYGSVRPDWSHDMVPEDVHRDVDRWVQAGVRGFKAKRIHAAQLRALIERAHHHGFTVTGHLGSGYRDSVNPRDAIRMGIDRIEHFLGGDALPADRSAYASLENLDPHDPAVEAVIRMYVDHGVAFDATLTAYGYFGERREGYDYWVDEREFFTDHFRAWFAARERPQVIEQFEKIYWVKRKTVKKFFDAGGTITLGTDHFSSGEFLPGFSAHRELDALVLAGIPPADAIRIGTINGARAIGMGDRVGSIEVGKLADLFVVKGNPLRNIRATRTVHLVMKGGTFYETRELLDSVRGMLGPRSTAEHGQW
jgi:imidazolonepropionase-like amidohydrolase